MADKLVWLMPITALAVSAVVVFGTAAASVKPPSAQETETQVTTVATELTEVKYILKIWGDGLGMFRGESEEPYREVEMPLNLLAEYDRERLEKGIEVETEEEIRSLVEDITS